LSQGEVDLDSLLADLQVTDGLLVGEVHFPVSRDQRMSLSGHRESFGRALSARERATIAVSAVMLSASAEPSAVTMPPDSCSKPYGGGRLLVVR
jgi:hypothetical protein